jgi:DNA-binding response OmpR family regulator
LSKQRSVLIVEDDHELRRMFRYALGVAGYAVTEASDGIQALRQLELERPDLIILDLGLPLLSGLDVQQEIAAHASLRGVLVVIVTGSNAQLDGVLVECVLRKPVSPEHVVDVVAKCFAAHARRDAS